MADLPICRMTSGNPRFHFTGIDFFGLIFVKQGRSQVKCYGCVFTCLTIRAVHLELSYSLDIDMDAFINALGDLLNAETNLILFTLITV